MKLELYVAGGRKASLTALRNLKHFLERPGLPMAELTVLDVLTDPLAALRNGILITPTLIRRAPDPVRIAVGTLDDPDQLAALLELS